MTNNPALTALGDLVGDALHVDVASRRLYATDASEYLELPLAVVLPRKESDVAATIAWAHAAGVGLIPRGAGTSLAGQVVGGGVVIDFSRSMNQIIAIDPVTRRARVQPGVIRNELNLALKPHGLFFAPETSTANRATIGGMAGNNSCGANSIMYGTTREHLISMRGFLSDGTDAVFEPLDAAGFVAKCDNTTGMERDIHRRVAMILGDAKNRELICKNFPKSTVTRRNTGYALDRLMECQPFGGDDAPPFNLCRLLAGSEGTLFVAVEYELNLEPLPPLGGLLCAHFESVDDALNATLIAMRHQPFGCELIDRNILECTRANIEQTRNRFFIEGDPGAVLVIDLRNEDRGVVEQGFALIVAELRSAGLGYAFPTLWGTDVDRVWELRRAGQGLMANIPGDAKPREVVEDTAVAVADLPAYIAEFDELLRSKYRTSCVYYAHAGAGELHTRPLFNLKTAEGVELFRAIATDVAALVKKYRGSLSGEHGDGRLRGEFIPYMVGPECFEMIERIKRAFDPKGILNPGKIVDALPLDTGLRYGPGYPEPQHPTVLDFEAQGGLLRAAEQCNGVGECRKAASMGGTMCPTFMVTGDERDSTRGRANLLRHALSASDSDGQVGGDPSVNQVMERCISCKGCKSECPSNVDLARLKAEWQQLRHDRDGVPWRSRIVAGSAKWLRRMRPVAPLFNASLQAPVLGNAFRRVLGFATERSIPELSRTSLRDWFALHANPNPREYPRGRVFLFCDEFSDTTDLHVGVAAIELLNNLGWKVELPSHVDSGRAQISKGMLRDARRLADQNVRMLLPFVGENDHLIGLEPSAILGFRDEYPDLVSPGYRKGAAQLASRAVLLEEFLALHAESGELDASHFDTTPRRVLVHGHCHQKALSSMDPLVKALSLPAGHQVEVVPSGCCGMAGSFGYETEHYQLSMQIGELVLLPAVRAAGEEAVVVAPGTSCRHQILDGTDRKALHPAELLLGALSHPPPPHGGGVS